MQRHLVSWTCRSSNGGDAAAAQTLILSLDISLPCVLLSIEHRPWTLGLLRLPGHCWGIAAIVLVGGRHAGGLQVIGGGGSLKVAQRWVTEGEEVAAAAEIRCGALIFLAACGGVGMFLFNVVVFSPTISLSTHTALQSLRLHIFS